jgi:geranylgeranyl diphosphate synthase type I
MSSDQVPAILGRARDLVVPALRNAIERLTPELRGVAEYHLGWRDEHGEPVRSDGGKGVRPAFAILSAEAVGGDAAIGLPGAVAIELVHNFSLIHDDVIDEDHERRHRRTVWSLFGIGNAVIVGDALAALAQQVILEAAADEQRAGRAARCIADATAGMIAGQALDMAFETRRDVDVAACLEMEAGKTGALLGCATAIGAILAGGTEASVNGLYDFGVELGLSFQAVDDLLGIWGDPAATGKPTWSDLRQRKKSLPVVAALASGSRRARELQALLEAPSLDEAAVEQAALLVEECGGRDFAMKEAEAHLDASLAAIESLELVSSTRDELVDLAHFVIDRSF